MAVQVQLNNMPIRAMRIKNIESQHQGEAQIAHAGRPSKYLQGFHFASLCPGQHYAL
jgi:hypothetical protein